MFFPCPGADAHYTSSVPKRTQQGVEVEDVDKKTEFRSFLLLVVVLAPVLSIAIVGGYGFTVWISQIIFGPPG